MGQVVVDKGLTLNVERVPPKSLVIVWALMTAELAFDLVTTIIAFIATFDDGTCCGSPIYLGPLPLSVTIPFFVLVLTEFMFLARAVMLTLWPSKFATSSIGDDDDDNDNHDGGSSSSKTDEERDDGTSSNNKEDSVDGQEKDKKGQTVVKPGSVVVSSCNVKTNKQPVKERSITSSGQEGSKKVSISKSDVETGQSRSTSVVKKNNQVTCKDEEPVFVDGRTDGNGDRRRRFGISQALCCCFEWNAKVVLAVLGVLTLLNPIFGCIIAWMLLYQSNRIESFIVLGLEGASIILHFIGIRLEGGFRTWKSKLLHSLILLPFLVTVTLVLVYLREGGVCYDVQSQLFLFSGCEVCEDGSPPVDGQCSNVTVTDGSSFGGLINADKFDINNFGALTERGMAQSTYCSPDVNFCFYPF